MERDPLMQKSNNEMFLNASEQSHFKELIDDYKPSDDTIEMFKSSDFSVIAGPAGAGKDTLRGRLVGLQPYKYRAILSSTTRPMRPKERDGIDYHFVSKEYMENGIKNKNFLQAALVHNQQISALDINDISGLSEEQTGLAILVVQTEQELRRYKPDIKTIFLIPPSFEDMSNRLKRITRNLSEEEIKRRLTASKYEIEFALDHPDYYCLVSKKPEKTLALAKNFLENGQRNQDEQNLAITTMRSFLSNY